MDKIDENNSGITYVNQDGIFYPVYKPIPPETETRTIKKYGSFRRAFLEEHKPTLVMQLQLKGQWKKHLADYQERGEEIVWNLREKMEEADPGSDKNEFPLQWIAHRNMLIAQAEEIMYRDFLYV